MKLKDKLQQLRKQHGFTQEELADNIGISRQTISKWENGQAIPELSGLLTLSELYGISIDRIVKEEECNLPLSATSCTSIEQLIPFLIRAKRNTYAGHGSKAAPSRTASNDYRYQEGTYEYIDTYIGDTTFLGEEVIWIEDVPFWGMNYMGHIIGEYFSNEFLKAALYHVSSEFPFRGPAHFTKGDYHYDCKSIGTFTWFQGMEEIYYNDKKIYEGRFHGGALSS